MIEDEQQCNRIIIAQYFKNVILYQVAFIDSPSLLLVALLDVLIVRLRRLLVAASVRLRMQLSIWYALSSDIVLYRIPEKYTSFIHLLDMSITDSQLQEAVNVYNKCSTGHR